MKKFNVGDKVKLIDTEGEVDTYKNRIGKIGIVQKCDWIIESAVNIKWNDGYTSAVTPFEKNLELVEEETTMFKVRCISTKGVYTVGKIYEVKDEKITCDDGGKIYFKSVKHYNDTSISKFELVQDFTLSDIKEGWKIILANGKEVIKIRDKFQANDCCLYIVGFDKNLTDKHNPDWNIVKVLKPQYEEVWTRPVESKIDVTLEEIIKDYEERNKCKVNVTKESK